MTTQDAETPRYTPIHLRRELLAQGYDDRAIHRAVETGDLAKARRGAYVRAEDWTSLEEAGRHCVRSRAVLRQASTGLVLSHSSALVEHDAPTFGVSLDEVEVTRLDARSGRRERGVRQHRGVVRPEELCTIHGAVVTGPAATVLDVATVVPTEAALCVANFFLHARLTDEEDLATLARTRRHRPGMLHAGIALRLADGRIESVGESRTLWVCFQQGLPAPVPQVPVLDRNHRLFARVDFAWPERGVFVEFDGRVKYGRLLRPGQSLAEAIDLEKRREEEICRLTGWRCVRLVWGDLDHPVRTAYRIRSMFRPGDPGSRVA